MSSSHLYTRHNQETVEPSKPSKWRQKEAPQCTVCAWSWIVFPVYRRKIRSGSSQFPGEILRLTLFHVSPTSAHVRKYLIPIRVRNSIQQRLQVAILAPISRKLRNLSESETKSHVASYFRHNSRCRLCDLDPLEIASRDRPSH
jgi:hypothetical protein